jgi:hypothetical protein
MTTTLPPFGDQEVHKAAIKMTGAGTGLSEGIKVKPLVLDIGETAYFVIEARCAGVEHTEDKDEFITRVHKLHTENMAPISEDIAQQALLAYTREIEGAKAAADGQDALFDPASAFQGRTGIGNAPTAAEVAAADAEALDETGTPGEVAQAAADRVKGDSNVVAFSSEPADA